MQPLRQIRWALLLLGVLFVVSLVTFRHLTGCSWIESAYFFVSAVMTVGFGERSQATPQVQVFTIFLVLIGATLVGYTVALLLQVMVEGHVRKALGLQRMSREIARLKGHTIICGYGRIGRTLAEDLRRREAPFVMVDKDSESVIAATDEGMLAVHGDALEEETLLRAGIEHATTIVVALRNDADNVFLTLTARNLNRTLRIIARGEMPSTEKKLIQAGADRVILPAVIGARRIAALITRPHAAEMMEQVIDHRILDAELEELSIGDRGPLVDKTVREAATRQVHRVMIIAIRRGDGRMVFNPDPDEAFQAGDTVIVMGKQPDVAAFKKAYRCSSQA